MKNPCINICEMNPVTGLCNGCGRTGEEINQWQSFTDKERDQIMEELIVRMFGD